MASVVARARLFDKHSADLRRAHLTRREQDEIVCRCGKRWPVGETHP